MGDGDSLKKLGVAIVGAVAVAGLLAWGLRRAGVVGGGPRLVFVAYPVPGHEKEPPADLYVSNGSGKKRLCSQESAPEGRQVADEIAVSPDGKKLAWWSTTRTPNEAQVVVMNVDCTEEKVLWRGWGSASRPRWSPDGTKLAFARYVETEATAEQILAGSSKKQPWLATPQYAGKKLTTKHWDVALLPVAGGAQPESVGATFDDEQEPAWSPDGKRVVYSSKHDGEGDLYVWDTVASRAERITQGDRGAPRQPVFSPDGRTVAYVDAKRKVSGLYLADADGVNERHLLMASDAIVANAVADADIYDPLFTPDGKAIVVTARHDTQGMTMSLSKARVFVVPVDGSPPTMPIDGHAYCPAISPDGKRLAVQAEMSGRAARAESWLVTVGLDGKGSDELATSTSCASWIP